VDNECHTGTLFEAPGLGKRYEEALQRGLLTQADLDRALVRLFAARYRNGDLPGIAGPNTVPVSPPWPIRPSTVPWRCARRWKAWCC
jgi:beta-glucosidase